MQFLKTLFWVVFAAVAVIFCMKNWNPVPINLWGGLGAEVKLPVMLAGSFFLGYLPLFIFHRGARWQWKRRLEASQREIAALRAQYEPVIVTSDPTPTTISAIDPAHPLP